MDVLQFLAIPIGYLLGGFPSAYIIGRFWGRVDIIREGDGHVSATAVYRQSGLFPFITVVILDVGKGVLAILTATAITDNLYIILVAGLAAVVGHCWSVYIKFRGGLGATAIYGVLLGLVSWQFLIGFVIGLIVFLITRKSTLSTIILLVTISIVLFVNEENLPLVLYPLSFILIQFLKRFQIKKSGSKDTYKNELISDLKRVK
jgi:glycerol-3-phosphate acyltransferase PlsY